MHGNDSGYATRSLEATLALYPYPTCQRAVSEIVSQAASIGIIYHATNIMPSHFYNEQPYT